MRSGLLLGALLIFACGSDEGMTDEGVGSDQGGGSDSGDIWTASYVVDGQERVFEGTVFEVTSSEDMGVTFFSIEMFTSESGDPILDLVRVTSEGEPGASDQITLEDTERAATCIRPGGLGSFIQFTQQDADATVGSFSTDGVICTTSDLGIAQVTVSGTFNTREPVRVE